MSHCPILAGSGAPNSTQTRGESLSVPPSCFWETEVPLTPADGHLVGLPLEAWRSWPFTDLPLSRQSSVAPAFFEWATLSPFLCPLDGGASAMSAKCLSLPPFFLECSSLPYYRSSSGVMLLPL